MTSILPNTQAMNYTHMFDMVDLNGCLPRVEPCKSTITGFLYNNPKYSKFYSILNKSRMNSLYDSTMSNFTLFIPDNDSIYHINTDYIDLALARHIIKCSTLNFKVSGDMLEDSPASYFITNDPPNRLYITNMNNETVINNRINVIQKDVKVSNGIIHVIDGLILPNVMI